VGLNDGLPAGATSLDGEEMEGLLPSHLVSRSQLNEWEQQNIEAALLWLSRQLSLPRFQGQCLESCFYTDPMKTNDHNECPFYATPLQR